VECEPGDEVTAGGACLDRMLIQPPVGAAGPFPINRRD